MTMTRIICNNIETAGGYILDQVTINVYLNESNTIAEDYRAIKEELEIQLGLRIIKFTFSWA